MQSILQFISANGEVITWLLVAIALMAVEAVTVQMVCIWFALGAFVALFTAIAGMPIPVQFMVFAVISLLSLAFTRKFVMGWLQVKKTPTNADSIIGLCGSVTEDIDNDSQQGRVYVSGLSWSARSQSGAPISIGTTVVVQSISGVKLLVVPKDE